MAKVISVIVSKDMQVIVFVVYLHCLLDSKMCLYHFALFFQSDIKYKNKNHQYFHFVIYFSFFFIFHHPSSISLYPEVAHAHRYIQTRYVLRSYFTGNHDKSGEEVAHWSIISLWLWLAFICSFTEIYFIFFLSTFCTHKSAFWVA